MADVNGPRVDDRATSVERSGEGEFRTSFDTAKGDVTVVVSLALEEVAGIDAEEVISSWTEYADPDALDNLFRERPNGELRHPGGYVSLSIKGIDVTVHSDGTIELVP